MAVYLIRYSEIGLKGPRARRSMEEALLKNIRTVLSRHGNVSFETTRGRFFLNTDINADKVTELLSSVFGIKSFSPVTENEFASMDELIEIIYGYFRESVSGKKFAVRCRRSGTHGFTSIEVERAAGERLFPRSAGVNLTKPDIEINVEIRGNKAYMFTEVIRGPGGLPVPSQGRMVSLMSGGIDSPVASWYLMKRGAIVSPIFFSLAHPVDTVYFLDSAEKLLERWLSGRRTDVFIVDGRKLIEYTVSGKGLKYANVSFKRIIYRVAQEIAQKYNYHGIITGESLGQVSSQTSTNLEALSEGMTMPVYRPLIGLDKDEIIETARRIGTYQESDPGEFCSLFSAHPAVGIPKEVLLNEQIPEHLIHDLLANVQIIDSSKLEEYRKSLLAEELRAYSVDANATVIDMRGREAFKTAHYPGSVNVDLSDLGTLSETLDREKPVVLYCKKGLQSAYAASMLRSRGFTAYYADEKIIGKK